MKSALGLDPVRTFFDTLIHIAGGSLLGTTAVGILSSSVGTPDTDFSRITGLVVGGLIVSLLKMKKVI